MKVINTFCTTNLLSRLRLTSNFQIRYLLNIEYSKDSVECGVWRIENGTETMYIYEKNITVRRETEWYLDL